MKNSTQPFSSSNHSDSGFTLVELLVVIVIIISLAALGFLGTKTLKQKALQVDAASRGNQLYVAITGYAAEHSGMLPSGDMGGGGKRGLIWVNLIAPYLGRPEPEDKEVCKNWDDILTVYKKDPWVCPAVVSNPGEFAKLKETTGDPIGGFSYNDYPYGRTGARNWSGYGRILNPTLAGMPLSASRLGVVASGYDWHSKAPAYDRFGKNKSLVTYFDGHSAFVNRQGVADAGFGPATPPTK